MGKKMKLPFLSHSKSLEPHDNLSLSPPWPFPSCGHIKTLSFRATNPNAMKDDAYRTFNSAFQDPEMMMTPPDSFFTTVSSSSRSFSTMSEDEGEPSDESVIRGLRSDRLFFDPQVSSSLVSLSLEETLEEEGSGEGERVESMESRDAQVIISRVESMESATTEECNNPNSVGNSTTRVVYKESEMLSLESSNPYEDFRKSMEEMVEAHGLKDWQGLEELLACYLKINGKNNHGYIMGAFIDILVNLSSFDESLPSTSTQTPTNTTMTSSSSHSLTNSTYSSPSSPLSLPSSSSMTTTPCLSSILDHGDGDDDVENEEEKGSDDELHDEDNDGVDQVSS